MSKAPRGDVNDNLNNLDNLSVPSRTYARRARSPAFLCVILYTSVNMLERGRPRPHPNAPEGHDRRCVKKIRVD